MAAPQPTYSAPPSRPLGVAILSVLVGLYGFIIIVVGALLLVGATVLGFLGIPTHLAGISTAVLGAVVLVVGLIILGLAVGLWHLRMWALVLTILFLLFELVTYGLAGAFITLGFIFALILFLYLLAVRHHFR